MTENSSVLKLIGLGFYQMLVNNEFSPEYAETIIDGLPKSGEKIELSAEEIKAMTVFVLELHLKRAKMEVDVCLTQLRDF